MSAIEALQTTLAAEHAAIYVYGVLGAQTSRSGTPELFATLTDAYVQHRARRDHLVALLRDEDETPTPAAPAYVVPPDLTSPERRTRAALDLELAAAVTYRYLVSSTEGAVRHWGVTALTDAAVRALGFGGRPTLLPGSPA